MSVTTEQIRKLPGMTPPAPPRVVIVATDGSRYYHDSSPEAFARTYAQACETHTAIKVYASYVSQELWLTPGHILRWSSAPAAQA